MFPSGAQMAENSALQGRRIALIEDDRVMGESLMVRLSLEGAELRWWSVAEDALRGVPAFAPEAVICDIRLARISGEDLFRDLSRKTAAPFLFMTAYSDIDQAVRLMRAGAADYVTKPFEFADFKSRLERLLLPGAGALGPSPEMRRIEEQLQRLAVRPAIPVLLTGETGAGKHVCARFLHDGDDPEAPFVVVDCASLSRADADGVLFGEAGLVAAAADGGTLFLDEIAELPQDVQPRFLRIIEDRSFSPSTGSVSRLFKGRIVCATNADLRAQARKGRFREDLLFRIDVAGLHVPPLRDRQEDILWLMNLFLRRIAAATSQIPPKLTSSVEVLALQHSWPGNVRELRNRVERAAALAVGIISPADLFPDLVERGDEVSSLADMRDLIERQHIRRVLEQTQGNVPEAAVLLGVSRSTLFEKMPRLGLTRSSG